MKKLFLIALIIISINLSAQSNEMIDRMLDSELADFPTAALLILQSAKILDVSKTPNEAIAYLKERNWMKKLKTANEPITMGEAFFLLMKAFDIKGGMAWSINPTPRSATREMQFIGAIYNPDKSPYQKVSGVEVLNMISWVLDYMESEGVSNETDR